MPLIISDDERRVGVEVHLRPVLQRDAPDLADTGVVVGAPTVAIGRRQRQDRDACGKTEPDKATDAAAALCAQLPEPPFGDRYLAEIAPQCPQFFVGRPMIRMLVEPALECLAVDNGRILGLHSRNPAGSRLQNAVIDCLAIATHSCLPVELKMPSGGPKESLPSS